MVMHSQWMDARTLQAAAHATTVAPDTLRAPDTHRAPRGRRGALPASVLRDSQGPRSVEGKGPWQGRYCSRAYLSRYWALCELTAWDGAPRPPLHSAACAPAPSKPPRLADHGALFYPKIAEA